MCSSSRLHTIPLFHCLRKLLFHQVIPLRHIRYNMVFKDTPCNLIENIKVWTFSVNVYDETDVIVDWNNGTYDYSSPPYPHPRPWRNNNNINNIVRRYPRPRPQAYNRHGHHEYSQPSGVLLTHVSKIPDGRHQQIQSWRRDSDIRYSQHRRDSEYTKPEKPRAFRQLPDKAYHGHTYRGQYVTRAPPEVIDRMEVHPAANDGVDVLVHKGDSTKCADSLGEQDNQQTSPSNKSHEPVIGLRPAEIRASSPPILQPSEIMKTHTKPRPEHASQQRSPSPSHQRSVRDTVRARHNPEHSNQTSDAGSSRTPSPSPSMDVDPRPSSPLGKMPQSPQSDIATTSEDQDMDENWEEHYEKEDEIQPSPAKFRVDTPQTKDNDMFINPWSQNSS